MPRDKKPLLGTEFRKLQPKLRMIANGSSMVNAIRSSRSSTIATTGRAPADVGSRVTGSVHAPMSKERLPKSEAPTRLARIATDVVANVFIHTVDALDHRKRAPIGKVKSPYGKGRILTGRVRLSDLPALARDGAVTNIELGEPLAHPRPRITRARPDMPEADRWRFGNPRVHHYGKDLVLIGIIDVQGFDFSHDDFLEDGKTRFVRIWDQGGDPSRSPKRRGKSEFDYGAEFRKDELNAAIRDAKKLKVPAHRIEAQSQTVEGSHGTHVASIAAGKHGVCKRAPIAAVLLNLPNDDADRRRSLYDSTRIVHAFDYLIGVAEEMGLPVSINISLGTNGHAHDGSSAVSRWIDSGLAVPGRCVSVAAGNAGQDAAQFEGDEGFVLGRIHTAGRVDARGLNRDIEWTVVGNGRADVSENELELWYGSEDRIAVSIRPPGGSWIGPVEPGQYLENHQLPTKTMVSVYNEVYHSANGANYIAIYLSPFFGRSGIIGIPGGLWTIRLHAREIRGGRYDAWIERDDPRPVGRVGEKELWNFPSFFSERSNVDHSSVGSLACGRWVVGVANLDEARERIHFTSSQGPTRDQRSKPEVAAPGTDIVAAKGFAGPKDYIAMTGTSMASPFVAGVAGLMLAANKRLTAAQIGGIMQATSRPLPGGTFAWANDVGFGVIDPNACLGEARTVNERIDITKDRR